MKTAAELTEELLRDARDATWRAVLTLVALKIMADCRCGNVEPAEFVKQVYKEMEQYTPYEPAVLVKEATDPRVPTPYAGDVR